MIDSRKIIMLGLICSLSGSAQQAAVDRNDYRLNVLERNSEKLGDLIEKNQAAILALDRSTVVFASGQSAVLDRLDKIEKSQERVGTELLRQSGQLLEISNYAAAGVWWVKVGTVLVGICTALVLLFLRLSHLRDMFRVDTRNGRDEH